MAETKAKKDSVVVAKTDDGTVTLTFTLPWNEVDTQIKKAVKKLGEGITVPGFRKGNAPEDIVSTKIPREELIQEIIGNLLPPLITKAYTDNDIKPVMYPKLDLLHAHDNEDWEVRVTTAQFPEIKLGDYKKYVKTALEKKTEKELSTEERESLALKTVLDKVELNLPKILVEEEANNRISNLLARIEKLGLTLENYLASQKKTIEDIRSEYSTQAAEAIKMELILGKIAEDEKITVTDPEIHAFSEALMADPRRDGTSLSEEDHANIRTLLMKRKAIELLVK